MTINLESFSGNELVLRTGDAAKVNEYTPFVEHGVLTAPGAFLSARKKTLVKDWCALLIDSDKGKIEFRIYHDTNHIDHIFGSLKSSKAIQDFGINSTDRSYSSKELAKFFRKNAFYFADKDTQVEIIKALMKFEATVTTIIEDTSDNRGNIKKLLDKKVSTEIPEKFVMKAPIFSGYEAVEFEVLIGAEASNSDVRFFLESPELFLLSEQEKGKLISDEVKAFEDFGCAVLYLS